MCACNGGGIEISPPGAQVLVGANEIGRAGRRVETLGELSLAVEKILVDDGQRDAGNARPATAFTVAVLHIDEFELAAQALEQMSCTEPSARASGASGGGAPSFVAPANGASSGVDNGDA